MVRVDKRRQRKRWMQYVRFQFSNCTRMGVPVSSLKMEAKVESATPNTQDVLKPQATVAFTLLWALLAIISTSVAIVGHWSTYRWMDRALAVAFILTLLFPLSLVFSRKGRMKVFGAAAINSMGLGYIWVFMATLLFNRL